MPAGDWRRALLWAQRQAFGAERSAWRKDEALRIETLEWTKRRHVAEVQQLKGERDERAAACRGECVSATTHLCILACFRSFSAILVSC